MEEINEFSQLSVYELYKQGKELTTVGEYDQAKKLFEQAIQQSQEDNEQLYVQYGHLLMLMKETELAKEILRKSITLQTKSKCEYNKYFELGQLLEGQESAELYLQGIKIIEQQLQQTEQINILDQNNDIERLKQDLCDGYGALSELYMSDLENEQNAQDICYQYIMKGLSIDQRSIDCNLQLSNYYLRLGDDQQAINAINIVCEEIINQENNTNIGCDQGIEFLIKVAQVAIELKQFELAIGVLKIVIDKDINDIEGLYLMAFSQFQVSFYYLLIKKDWKY